MGARDESQLERGPSSRLASPDYPDIPLLHYHAPLFLNQLLAPICLILNFFLDLNVISFLWCGDYLSRSTILSFSCPVERHRKVIKCFPWLLTPRSLYQKWKIALSEWVPAGINGRLLIFCTWVDLKHLRRRT